LLDYQENREFKTVYFDQATAFYDIKVMFQNRKLVTSGARPRDGKCLLFLNAYRDRSSRGLECQRDWSACDTGSGHSHRYYTDCSLNREKRINILAIKIVTALLEDWPVLKKWGFDKEDIVEEILKLEL
jgi:hypothetical protein